jgi:hypothetical protein
MEVKVENVGINTSLERTLNHETAREKSLFCQITDPPLIPMRLAEVRNAQTLCT